MIGTTLDRYQIESKLGEGGMGVVYKARDTHLDRPVAIKVLPPDKVANADRRRRFTQEARAASALNHPGIVTVHDIRSAAGIDFIVMEFVDGRTLDQLIPPAGLAVPRALRYGVAIATAMAKAHEAGIIHRDLKPSNVILLHEPGGLRAILTDFGLAKSVSGEGMTVGPILMGVAKPAHVLTPSSTYRRVLNMTALAAAQAGLSAVVKRAVGA